jgi:hypothetical protein
MFYIVFCEGNFKMKFLVASVKSPSVKFLPITIFRGACADFLIAAWSQPVCDPEKLFRKPAKKVHKNKSTNESRGKPEQKFDEAFGTTFRMSKCYSQVFLKKQAKTF